MIILITEYFRHNTPLVFEQVRKKWTIEKRALLMQNIHQEGIFMPRSYRHISNYEKNIRNESTRIDPEIENELMQDFLSHTGRK